MNNFDKETPNKTSLAVLTSISANVFITKFNTHPINP